MPNVVEGAAYSKEYKGDDSAGQDALCIQRSAASPGKRVVLVDDLVATGGTLLAGVDLVKGLVSVKFSCNRVASWCCVVRSDSRQMVPNIVNSSDREHMHIGSLPIASLLLVPCYRGRLNAWNSQHLCENMYRTVNKVAFIVYPSRLTEQTSETTLDRGK